MFLFLQKIKEHKLNNKIINTTLRMRIVTFDNEEILKKIEDINMRIDEIEYYTRFNTIVCLTIGILIGKWL